MTDKKIGLTQDRALRLTFSYVGSDVYLMSRQSVKMMLPPSDPLSYPREQSGFWFEVKDVNGRTLYRRIMQNPIKYAVEIRTDDPERPLMWHEVSEPKGVFVLLVPELDNAHTIVLYSSPLEPEGIGKPATEINRFGLKQGPDIEMDKK
jgi:hypothetical protein